MSFMRMGWHKPCILAYKTTLTCSFIYQFNWLLGALVLQFPCCLATVLLIKTTYRDNNINLNSHFLLTCLIVLSLYLKEVYFSSSSWFYFIFLDFIFIFLTYCLIDCQYEVRMLGSVHYLDFFQFLFFFFQSSLYFMNAWILNYLNLFALKWREFED
jgi:hypothetical protein